MLMWVDVQVHQWLLHCSARHAAVLRQSPCWAAKALLLLLCIDYSLCVQSTYQTCCLMAATSWAVASTWSTVVWQVTWWFKHHDCIVSFHVDSQSCAWADSIIVKLYPKPLEMLIGSQLHTAWTNWFWDAASAEHKQQWLTHPYSWEQLFLFVYPTALKCYQITCWRLSAHTLVLSYCVTIARYTYVGPLVHVARYAVLSCYAFFELACFHLLCFLSASLSFDSFVTATQVLAMRRAGAASWPATDALHQSIFESRSKAPIATSSWSRFDGRWLLMKTWVIYHLMVARYLRIRGPAT